MAEDEKGAEGAADGGDEPNAGLVAKNKELLGEVKALKTRMKAFTDLDPDAAREALDFKAHAEEELAAKRGEFEKLRAKDRERFEAERGKIAEREAKLRKALTERLVDHALSEAIRREGGDPDYVLEKGRSRVQVVETEDGWETVVSDAAGKSSTMETLAKELREKYPRAFDGTGSSGSGAAASVATGGSQRVLTDPYEIGRRGSEELERRRRAAIMR